MTVENDLASEIDRLLAERRPDRYDTEGGTEWLDGVADAVAHLVPEARARFLHARSLVGRRETQKLQAANRLLREMYAARELSLGWLELLNLPIAVGKERVALRAATSGDLFQFAIDERRRAANDFSVRNTTCEAAEWLASQLEAQGAVTALSLSLDGAS